MAKGSKSSRRAARKPNDSEQSIIPRGPYWAPKEGRDGLINHKFVTTTSVFSIPGNAVNPVLGGQAITFNQLSNFGLYTALFDQYRIDVVEVSFFLRKDPGTSRYARLNVFPDFDDASPPSTLANAQSHPRLMQHVFTEAHPTFRFSFQPRLAVAAFGGAFTQYTSPQGPVFVDSSNPGAQHYGWKYAVENFDDTTNAIEVIYKVWFTCRSPL
jgi:hypothetical protein